jgi:hypothetical protein
MRLRQLFEAPSIAVMAFGRMNPPTIGHAKLVDAVKSQGGDPYIFLSQSQKPKTDPLNFEDKLRYAKFFFPNVTIGNPEVKTIIQALQKIEQLGYENLVYVAGSDRVESFKELINKYNGKDYKFKNITVVSAGERDPDADGAEGMSASKMRAAAAAGDLESFKQGVPNQEVADEMYAAVRQGMGIRDDVNEAEVRPPVAQKIEPIEMPDPPKAPDATIPRTRNGYTTEDGTTYKQDKYNENIMHVSNGGGTYTFDDNRLIKWTTPKIQGYRQIHDFVQRTIKVDSDTTVKSPEGGDVVISTNAVYDLEGNLQNGGELGISAGGASTGISDKEIKLDFVISDRLSIHAKGPRNTNIDPKTKQQLAQLVAKTQSGAMNQGNLIAAANAFRKAGASITFKSPANGPAIPFNQGVEMLRQAGE